MTRPVNDSRPLTVAPSSDFQKALTSWMPGAACASRPDLPWLDENAPAFMIERMATVCLGCPVLAECDAFAATMNEQMQTGTGIGGNWAVKPPTNTAPTGLHGQSLLYGQAFAVVPLPGFENGPVAA